MSKTSKKQATSSEKPTITPSMNDNKKQKIFITKDRDLIKQYYELRNRIFREECGLTHKKWSKVDYDDESEIIVFTVDGEVRGGLKIFISRNSELLSEEYEGTEFVYSNLLKELGLDVDKRYAEFVDLVIEKGFGGISCVKNIVKTALNVVKSEKCSYLFYISPVTHFNLYEASLRSCGCKNVKIFKDVVWKKIVEYDYSEDNPVLAIL